MRHQRDVSAAVTLYEVAAAYGGEVADISTRSGLDAARTAAGWRTLKEMGLVKVVDGRVETVEPQAALAVLMGSYTANVHEQLQSALAVNDATQKLLTVFQPAATRRQQQVQLLVDQYTGPESRERALRDIAATLRESADSLHQGPLPTDPAALDRSLEMDAGLARRGIRVRALYPRRLLSEPANARYLRRLSDVGVTVRVTDHIAHDMLIFDRHTVCLPGCAGLDARTATTAATATAQARAHTHTHPQAQTHEQTTRPTAVPGTTPSTPYGTDTPDAPSMIRIRCSLLVQSFASIYETYWQGATPLSLAGARPHHAELSAQERAVIRLMTNGYGDDRIATRLGIDRRAVEDVMVTLMERLGAGSRFEVGYKLARELDPRDL
ncbi:MULTISPECIES: LuxR C-terminal-related transcriptional regulator [unclassified Streptomyces]|uniref:LuxR C-terminal-related transcriptional regulator n=1 Tax=unclassified Streptomyces TaxID=2593676 RepID=UPI002E2AE9AB|nr:LuxR C-terminal-related transcriptional regulator [Streptomyces sp. NBC_00223]